MPIEITAQLVQQLRSALSKADREAVLLIISDLHEADLAEVYNELQPHEGRFVYSCLSDEQKAELLPELDEEVRETLLSSLSDIEIAETVDLLDSDDAADLISELPEERQEGVLAEMEDEEQADEIADLLTYDENTAGGLMATELIRVQLKWNVATCVREMRRQAEEVKEVYAVYVVDENDVLKGVLSLKKLLITPVRALVEEIYNEDIISVTADASSEEVANIMEKYDVVVLPVVDQEGKLLGRITIDDVVDVIKEEASKDYQMMSGISEDIEQTDKVWIISRARLPWLLVAMLGGIMASQVIGLHEDSLQIHPEMAFFMPLIAAMGGNVGVQSSAIIVQGLANNTLSRSGIFQKLLKELSVGLLNALACALLLLSYNLAFHHGLALSITVSIALVIVILFAAIFGTLVPLTLDRYKIDPALATGPFITTSNDIIGLFIYFMVARAMYGVI
jgi:magnesium transporter